jgi:putative MFS transporter
MPEAAPLTNQEHGGIPGVYGTLSESDSVEIADLVESFGLRWIHVALLAVTWVLLLCPSSIIMATPYVLGSLRQEYGIDRASSALIGSAVTLGAVVGVLTFGRLHDLAGRRATHLMAVIAIGVFSALHLVLPAVSSQEKGTFDAWFAFSQLLLLRLVLGVLFAGPASFAALYLIEFLPSQRRGFVLTLCTAGWSVGTLYAIWMASTFQGHWRIILAAPLPVCILAMIALMFSPESPRWLFVVGDSEKGCQVLDMIFDSRTLMVPKVDAPFTKTPFHVHVSKPPECSKTCRSMSSSSLLEGHGVDGTTFSNLRELFSRKMIRIVCAVGLVQMAVNGASYAMLVWSAEILTLLLQIPTAPYEIFVYSEISGWIGTICAAFMLDTVGRRLILIYSLSATAFCTWGLTMVPRTYAWISITFLALQFVGGGIWPAMTAYTAECFPTALRGTGGALVQACGRAMAVFFPIVMGAALDDKIWMKPRLPPVDMALWSAAGLSCMGAVGAALIPTETANAKIEDV